MTVIVVHNRYQQPGGEDRVFEGEPELLECGGHRVVRMEESNDRVREIGSAELVRKTMWNRDWYQRIFEGVRREKAEIVHFHNTFPLISPAAYYGARAAGAAVVQTLHNYRLICPGSVLMRKGAPCEVCVGSVVPWRGVAHRCYRSSLGASAVSAAMLAGHTLYGTWRRAVDAYIALTEFGRDRFLAGGLPPDRVHVKPNTLAVDPGPGTGGEDYVFVGRLTESKGIQVLLDAWSTPGDMPRLRIIGDGEAAARVRRAAELSDGRIEWLGWRPQGEVLAAVQTARALVMPSLNYEGFSMSLLEAMASATPVIASNLGTFPEVIEQNKTGFLFTPGDAPELGRLVRDERVNSSLAGPMRVQSRARFEAYYEGNRNLQLLEDIYRRALLVRQTERFRGRRSLPR